MSKRKKPSASDGRIALHVGVKALEALAGGRPITRHNVAAWALEGVNAEDDREAAQRALRAEAQAMADRYGDDR